MALGVKLSMANQSPLEAESHPTAASTCCRILLHLLAYFDVDVEELGNTAVEADGFALVEIFFVVVAGNALFCAGGDESMTQKSAKYTEIHHRGKRTIG